jgi:hypothetical protein
MRTFARTLLLFLAAAAAPLAFAGSFGGEKIVSTNASMGSQFPEVAYYNNVIHVVWVGCTGSCDIYYSRSTSATGTFSAPVNLSNTGGPVDHPQVTAGPHGVFVAWNSDNNTGAVYFRESTNSGTNDDGLGFINGTAPATMLIGGAEADGFYSRLTSIFTDATGNVHVGWFTNADTAGASGMIHHRLLCPTGPGATFSTEAAFTTQAGDGDVDNEEPRFAQDSTGQIYVIWRSTLHGNPQGGWPPYSVQMKKMSFPGGCSGAAAASYPSRRIAGGIPLSYASLYRPEIFGDSAGVVHVAWWDTITGANVYYRKGTLSTGTLGAAAKVSAFSVDHPEPGGLTSTPTTQTGGFQAPPAFVSNGTTAFIGYQQNSLVAASGLENGPVLLRESGNNGTTWGAEQAISTSGKGTTPRFAIGGAGNQNVAIVWSDLRSGTATVYYRLYTLGALAGGSSFAISPSPQDFGATNVSATGTPITLSLVNSGTAGTITSITPSGDFQVQSQTCGSTLGAGLSCTINVTFTPTALGARTGTITVVTDDVASPAIASLTGTGTVSPSFNANVNAIVTGYYETILGRSPDSGGLTFWSGEAIRVNGLGADVREAFYALSMTFFNSAEYLNKGTSDTQYVTDLYRTFFLRAPDGPGLSYWVSQLSGGMDRASLLNNFLFSTEFVNFMTGVFGSPSIRPEVNLTMDLFRGAFGRLPDSGGFNYWLGQIRTAQCGGGNAVNTAMDQYSALFLTSPEYGSRDAARAPNMRNPLYVSDLYNLFMRRGADLGGYNYWVNQVNTAQTRDQVRLAFLSSSEFQNRVGAVIAAGCYTGP